MKIRDRDVEAVCQALYDLQHKLKMAPLPLPGIIMPGIKYEQRYRAWIMPDRPEFMAPHLALKEESIPHYEGTEAECQRYLAFESMKIALTNAFRGASAPTDEPGDSLPQTGDTSAD